MADCEAILPWIKPGWIGAEIGVAQGNSALRLLQHGVKFLYLIDPWKNYEDLLDKVYPEAYYECMEKLSPYASRHGTLKMTSVEASRYVPPQLDFVWVDGNHRFMWVFDDLVRYWPKIKTGGVMCGHDYTDNSDSCQVKSAVDHFVHFNCLQPAHLVNSCWVIPKD
jgi:Methyltransferase domain